MSILSPARTAAMQAVAESPFAPKHAEWIARIEAAKLNDEAAAIAKAHILTFAGRMSKAMDAIREGNLGSARAFLEIGQRDLQAAINALPQ
jgi:hypothetical protein